MIAPSLFADLRSRGVRLSTAPGDGLKLRVQAPRGALTEPLRSGIARHRDELTQFVFELEERAALFEFEQGETRERAEELAPLCVVGGSAGPDGALWLRDLAEHHPTVQRARAALMYATRGAVEIVSVERIESAESEAA